LNSWFSGILKKCQPKLTCIGYIADSIPAWCR
jgi:hypothetical protein